MQCITLVTFKSSKFDETFQNPHRSDLNPFTFLILFGTKKCRYYTVLHGTMNRLIDVVKCSGMEINARVCVCVCVENVFDCHGLSPLACYDSDV